MSLPSCTMAVAFLNIYFHDSRLACESSRRRGVPRQTVLGLYTRLTVQGPGWKAGWIHCICSTAGLKMPLGSSINVGKTATALHGHVYRHSGGSRFSSFCKPFTGLT